MLDKTDRRCKNFDWTVRPADPGQPASMAGAQLAVLMDIRDELQAIRRRLDCTMFLNIPNTLADIRRNTAKRKRKAPKRA
jgi:hypothetical protein